MIGVRGASDGGYPGSYGRNQPVARRRRVSDAAGSRYIRAYLAKVSITGRIHVFRFPEGGRALQADGESNDIPFVVAGLTKSVVAR